MSDLTVNSKVKYKAGKVYTMLELAEMAGYDPLDTVGIVVLGNVLLKRGDITIVEEEVKNQNFNNKIGSRLFDEKTTNDIIDDICVISRELPPVISPKDTYMALYVLNNINDGELYQGAFIALAISARYFCYNMCPDNQYSSQEQAILFMEKVEPILKNVNGIDYMSKYVLALYASMGKQSMMIDRILRNLNEVGTFMTYYLEKANDAGYINWRPY